MTSLSDTLTLSSKARRDITPVLSDDGLRYLIPLTLGLFAAIDKNDVNRIGEGAWTANKHWDGKYYAQRGSPDGGVLYLHRVIMGVTDPKIEVDHINREDTLNCTRANLRIADRSQQLCNTGLRSDSTTGYKGVSRYKRTGTFYAEITYRGKRINLGQFIQSEDAARIRDRAAIELHGEFAVLNFPRSDYEGLPPLGVMETYMRATRRCITHNGPRPLRQ